MKFEPAFEKRMEAYLVDFAKGIALHLYDDCGMDVISFERAATADVFAKFQEWLLDYDQARMTKTFEERTQLA